MPNFTVTERPSERFEGDFEWHHVEGYQPKDGDAVYLATLEHVLQTFAQDQEADKTDQASAAIRNARAAKRATAALRLREDFEAFNNDRLTPSDAAMRARDTRDLYVAELEPLKSTLFSIDLELDEDRFATGLRIRVNEGLPPPNDQPTEQQQSLFVDLQNAVSVVTNVSALARERPRRPIASRLTSESRKVAVDAEARKRLDEYIRKLHRIGELGLIRPYTQLARLALEGFKSDFVAREAGQIKNDYVRTLGLAAGSAVLLFLTAYIAMAFTSAGSWWDLHKTFALAAVGAAVGTWLSFSIRRVQLSFESLSMLEEDLLAPSLRVIFVIALTTAACLLFWTGAINIEIGGLKTERTTFMNSGTVALLIGIFCGLSERALATALSGRSATFIKGIGSGT